MHIALDLRMVGPQLHGIARYALELARRLPAQAPDSRFSVLVGPTFDSAILGEPRPNLQLVTARSRFLSVAEQAELPLLLHKLRPDLYHSPSFSVPSAYRGALALTIHDANHLAFPQHYGRFHGLYYRHIVRPGALRAQLVLTVSRFSQREIEDRLALPPGRVQVVYNGVDPSLRPADPASLPAFRRRLGLPERFVLYVGNTKPHKNLAQLLDAFAAMETDLWLVLCAGPRRERFLSRVGAKAARVKTLDAVAEADLPLLYSAATVFAFPSLYEGFGLPPLEAMACGTPVVATRATALPEVLADAAAFVEPGDVQGLARAIDAIACDPAHAQRLSAAGARRAARFSWDQTAREILEAYRRTAEPTGLRTDLPGPRSHSLKLLFCVRPNLWSLPGGDATQILRTRAALEELGVAVTLWTEPQAPARGSFDLAHLFHLTRLDTFVQAQGLAQIGLPFVLSTIYWPTGEFERRGYIGALRLLHTALSDGPADIAKNGIRAMLAEGEWRWAMLPEAMLPFEQRIRFLIERALLLLPNSKAEGAVLEELGATRVSPIVNASDLPPSRPVAPKAQLPQRYLLCVGRIEPRKNQLALAEALGNSKLPLVFVGDAGPMHRDYYRRLKKAAGPDVRFLPSHPRDQLFSMYAGAQAHIAPAWYETPGLVSLEAGAAGTRVVSTDRGSTREYFGDDAFYLDPGDPASIRDAVERALSSPRTPALRERILRDFTWQRAAEQTLEAYRAALQEVRRAAAPRRAWMRAL
jgi:glycosyltransferase involved in cell wall biosynthesis